MAVSRVQLLSQRIYVTSETDSRCTFTNVFMKIHIKSKFQNSEKNKLHVCRLTQGITISSFKRIKWKKYSDLNKGTGRTQDDGQISIE